MAKFAEAENRLFKNTWICMGCKGKQRSATGKPNKCRRCGSKRFRTKNKAAKKKAS